MFSNITAEGKYEPSRIGQTITDFLREKSRRLDVDYLGQLKALYASRQIGEQNEKAFTEAAGEIIDAVNAFDRVLPYGRINIAPISRLEEFAQLDTWRAIAEENILGGKIAFEGFYAGVGERMKHGKHGPFYAIDPWTVVEEYAQEPCSKLQGYSLPAAAIQGVGLGPRQLLQLRICLEELSKKQNRDPAAAISRFVIILHVNAQSESMVRDDLVHHHHYGFNPENVFFVPQPVLPGWHFDNGQLIPNSGSKFFPYNHGWARMQLNWRGQAYWTDKAGHEHPFAEAVVDRLLGCGIRYLTLNRINDLTRLSPHGTLDADLIALSLHLMQAQGYSLTVELVGNDTGQKGGFGLAAEESEDMFLVETLCAKSTYFAERMDRLTEEFRNTLSWQNEEEKKNSKIGIPYNAMRQVEDIQATKDALKEGLPVVLRFREGHIYLEVPTGDMTNLPGIRARAVMRMHDRFNPAIRNGELIYDLKTVEDAYKAPFFLKTQDIQPRFRKLVDALVRRMVDTL